jgi:hypothetical protein
MADDLTGDPIVRLYQQMLNERTSRGELTPRTGNQTLAVAALLAEIALRYDDLDRRIRILEAAQPRED